MLFRTMAVNRNVLIQMIPIFVDAKKGLDLIQIRKHAKVSNPLDGVKRAVNGFPSERMKVFFIIKVETNVSL